MSGSYEIRLEKTSDEGRYRVRLDGPVIGEVWKETGWVENRTRWGTTNSVRPHRVATWWRAQGEADEFETRKDAVADLVSRVLRARETRPVVPGETA